MVSTPPKPMSIPMIIHLVIFVQRESQRVKMVMNNGTNAAIMAAKPLLMYSSDQVSSPFAIHNNKIPCNEIFFNASQLGNEYSFSKKKVTNIELYRNCLTPAPHSTSTF